MRGELKTLQMKINKESVLHLALIVILSFLVITVLFRGGNILGGGEVGAAFHNLSRVYDMVRWTWNDMFLGFSSGLTPASAPTFALLSFFERIGIPNFLIQATFFFFFLICAFFSSYLLSKEIFPDKSHNVWFFSSLFYQFNLYNVFNIWNRFLPNVILFYSFLPLAVLVYLRGLKLKKYRFALMVPLLGALFSYAVGSPSQSMIFWGIILLLTVYHFLIIKKDLFYFKYFLVCFTFWLLTNFWWVSQEFTFLFSRTYATARDQFFNPAGNISTFNAISQSLGQLRDLFLLRHGRINRIAEGYPFNWPFFYTNPIFSLLGWLVTLSVLFFSIRKIRRPYVSFFLLLFVVGLFFSKGNMPPFGEIFNAFFKKLSFLQFFRNPFEKLGILLPFSLSFLFGLAAGDLLDYLARRKTTFRLVKVSLLIYLPGLVGFPFFSGLVFTSENPPANNLSIGIQVEIPDYYKNADDWLSSQCDDCRFIAFPLSSGEGMYYKWPKGYVGLEQSGFLLNNSGISHNTTIPYYGKISSQLEYLFIRYRDFYKVSPLLNSKYLLLRKDIDFKLSGVRDPELMAEKVSERVSEESQLEEFIQFGDLYFFEISGDQVLPKMYASTGVIKSDEVGRLEDIFVTDFAKGNTIVSDITPELRSQLLASNASNVVGDVQTFQISESEYPMYTEASYIYPYVSHLPSYPYYKLLLLKEKFERSMKFTLEDRASWDLLMLGKRLHETRGSILIEDFDSAKTALSIYKSKLPLVFEEIMVLTQSLKQPDEIVWRERDMYLSFSSHLYLLKQFENTDLNKDGSISDLITDLKNYYSLSKVAPYWDILKNKDFPIDSRVVYQFNVEDEGEYEVFLPKTGHFPGSFNFDEELVQVDNNIVTVSFQERDEFVSLGKRYFDKGLHEIGINQKVNENLVNQSNFSLDANDQETKVSLDIKSFDPYSDYNISFDYFIRYGSGFDLILHHNTDKKSTKKDETIYHYNQHIEKDAYWHDRKNFSEIISPYRSSDTAQIIFRLEPWNNCEAIFTENKSKCENPTVRETFNRPSSVEIYNFSVTPRLPDRVYLVKGERKELYGPSVSYNKINPTRYEVSIKGAESPFLLIFSESYDSRWAAFFPTDTRGKLVSWFPKTQDKEYVVNSRHILANGYANAWWVDKKGNYSMVVEFLPQRLLSVGYIISITSILICLGIIIVSKRYEKKD